MKKVFFISNCNFPRGNPMANYIQYFMLAIKAAGYEPILISNINNEYISSKSSYTTYEKLQIVPLRTSTNRIIRHFQYNYIFPLISVQKLKELKITSEDIVFLYGENKILCMKALSLRKKINFKLVGAVGELFEKKDFSNRKAARIPGMLNRIYKNYMYVLGVLYPKFELVIPASTFINEFYKKKNVRTEIVPIMMDSNEFERKEKSFDKYRFILPAHGKMKDDLESMIRAFALLSDKQLAKIELHLCGGVKEKHIREILSLEEYERLKSVMIFYEWMRYDELIALYQRMHFLILARKTSQMTLANIPSKVPETMSYGIVPVVSEVGDYTKYYLRKGIDSIYIDGSTAQACYESLCTAISLSKEEYLTYSENAIRCVEKRFDYQVWVPTIKKLLDSLY